MSFISYLCFGVTFIIVISCFKKNADLLSPFRVYGFTWFFSIGLTDLKLSRFQHEWTIFSWIVLLIGFFSFFIGLYIIYYTSLKRNFQSPISIRNILAKTEINEQYLFIVIILLSTLYFISFSLETLIHGELPILSTTPDDSRKKYGVFGLHLIVTAMPVILFFIVQYYVFVKGKTSRKVLLTLIFVFIFVSYFTLLVRFNYIMFIFMTAGFIYYSSNLFKIKNILIASGVIITLFIFTLQIREARYAENFLYVISDLKVSKDYSFFAGPYMYIVMNLENFARVIDKLDQFTFGYYSFDFIFALTGLKHQLADYYGLEERIYLTSSFNTFPYIYPYYRDYGLLGVFLLPLILGGVVGVVHQSILSKPNVLNVSLYSFCVFFMAISFFTNPLTMLNTIFMLLLLVSINIIIMKDTVYG